MKVHLKACGILVPGPGIKPTPPAVELRSLNHWTIWEVLVSLLNNLLVIHLSHVGLLKIPHFHTRVHVHTHTHTHKLLVILGMDKTFPLTEFSVSLDSVQPI